MGDTHSAERLACGGSRVREVSWGVSRNKVRGRLQGRFVVVGRKLRWDRKCGIPHASAAGLMGFGDLGTWAGAGATALIRVWDRLFCRVGRYVAFARCGSARTRASRGVLCDHPAYVPVASAE